MASLQEFPSSLLPRAVSRRNSFPLPFRTPATQAINKSIFSCLVSDNDVMEHFAFPGNINFTADDQGAFSCIIHEMLLCLFIVCETMFAIVESRTRSTASACKSSPRKIFHWNSSGERRLKFIGQRIEEDNCEAERTSLSTAKATTLEKKNKAMGWIKRQLEIG